MVPWIQDKAENNALLYGIQCITNTGRETHGRSHHWHEDADYRTRDPFEEAHANTTQYMGSQAKLAGKETQEFRAKPGYAIIGIKVKSNFYLKVNDITQGKRSQNTALEVVDEGNVVTPKQLQIYQADFNRFDTNKSGAIEEKECKLLAAFQYGKKLTKAQWEVKETRHASHCTHLTAPLSGLDGNDGSEFGWKDHHRRIPRRCSGARVVCRLH